MGRVKTSGRTTAYIGCVSAVCNGAKGRPFFVARFTVQQAKEFVDLLSRCSPASGHVRSILTWTDDDARRFRLLDGVTPQYEQDAVPDYVRGDAFRVTGERSMNIEFSTNGARMIRECVESALSRADRFLELRIPNRRNRRDLIEFVPDVDLVMQTDGEHDALASAGALLAADSWPRDDFGDWGSADGQD